MKNKTIAIIALLAAALIYLGGCSFRNVETIKANSSATWEKAGFKVVGYEGYQIGEILQAPGGRVWYIVEKKDSPRVLYHGFITKWGDEFHIYNLKAIDALQP